MEILFGRNQLPVVISFFVCGIIVGVFCDLLRIKRYILFNTAVIIFLDDIIFFILCTIIIVFNAYCFNDGNMKWFEIPVMIVGFTLYRKTLSPLFIKGCFKVINMAKRVFYVVVLPARKLTSFCIKVFNTGFERLSLQVYMLNKAFYLSCWQITTMKERIK